MNKFVWSDQDWNPETPVIETLRDYARLFVGMDYQEIVAQGLISLENTFRGPLLTNESVERTLMQWQSMEQKAPLAVLQNPRFQMGQIRAYYDAYTRRRLLYETELEEQAKDALRGVGNGNSLAAIQQAKSDFGTGDKSADFARISPKMLRFGRFSFQKYRCTVDG